MKQRKHARKIVGLIPARGGSKGIPLKNIKELVGKPLIAFTIEEALKSKVLDRIIVSTDHEEIARISRECGAEVPFKRPADISEDVPTELVLKHAIKYLEEMENYRPDILVTLQPTSPLRKARDIDEAVNKLIETNADSVVSVCETDERPEWMLQIKDGEAMPFIGKEIKLVARQELPKLYKMNGAVFVSTRNLIMNEEKIVGGNMQVVVMEKERSVDIDIPIDFFIAELIMKGKLK
ncbi:acylneuraminate cytidylyltransferase family protein [Methanosarcinales archaeon]|nr:MAG: acylneuraminate cytidylyltransferase family protein [Methanosarcinales archaeon]